jgi:APA family basic amino acid/polyamine antiporter
MAKNQLFATKSLEQLNAEMEGGERLRRALGPISLTAIGVGAVIGAGIFVMVGDAARDLTGPALVLSFVVAGLACVFAALCYAEFASLVPVAGSAYTYGYATLGELFAWIIGWDLVLEYGVASAAVAQAWSENLLKLLKLFDVSLPAAYTATPWAFQDGHLVSSGAVMNLPALLIGLIVTIILVVGVRESATVNATMVAIKVGVVLFVVIVGAFYVNPANWAPFAPYGYGGISFFGWNVWGQTNAQGASIGMMAGAALIFFAYLGFDAVSTNAEEAKNPRRDLPIGIIASLLICTVLYIAVAAVLTGMVPYKDIEGGAPIAAAFEKRNLTFAAKLIAFGAMAGMTSVLLVMMMGQPRIFLAMARDGLLPKSVFGAVHPTFKTPWISTILTGIFVCAFSSMIPRQILADMTNIGTLFAFIIVCAAVLVLRKTNPDVPRPFKVPFGPVFPVLGIALCLLLMFSLKPENWYRLIIWLALGFVIYFAYGFRHSKLRKHLLAGQAG